MIFNGVIYAIYVLDKFLKTSDAEKNYKMVQKTPQALPEEEKSEIEKLYLEGVKNEFVMVPLGVVLTLITLWFFYLRFFISFMKRKKLVWVEVQDFKDPEFSVTRNEAKRNLHLICEMT